MRRFGFETSSITFVSSWAKVPDSNGGAWKDSVSVVVPHHKPFSVAVVKAGWTADTDRLRKRVYRPGVVRLLFLFVAVTPSSHCCIGPVNSRDCSGVVRERTVSDGPHMLGNPGCCLFEAHAVGVIRNRRGPIGEDPADPDVSREHV